MLTELLPSLVDVACNTFGRKVLLHVLAPTNRRYFSIADRELLEPLQAPRINKKTGEMEVGSARLWERGGRAMVAVCALGVGVCLNPVHHGPACGPPQMMVTSKKPDDVRRTVRGDVS